MIALRAEGINKSYRNHRALTDLSIEVPKQSIYGLLGPNGAGKTTLIRIINQILLADSGQVFLNDEPLCRKHIRDIGYLPEERGLYRKMKVGEQAIYLARLKGLSRHDAIMRLRDWFEKFEISGWWNKKVEELSKGMAQKVQFIVTVLHRPQLLIFDEPFSGFDPINVNILREEILRLRDEGATVIFSTHNMESVEEMCDHITLINQSRSVLTGPIDEVRRQFETSIYDLHYRGNPEAVRAAVPAGWSFEPGEPSEGYATAVLQNADSSIEPNPLLSALLPTAEVYRFTRRAARMNDIFIRVVKENTAQRAQAENEKR